jgi:catechol 2,3-dioxygenase-like lactoylglutathione lyase family enzyme
MTHRVLLAASLLASGVAAAQAPTVEPPFNAVAGTLVAISVSSIDSSTRWYKDKLGLKVIMELPKTATRNATTVLEGNGLLVELQEHVGAAAVNHSPSARQGIFKYGIFVTDYDATLAAIRARNIPIVIGPFPKRADQPANFIIRDNSGTAIQFLGPR